MTRCKVSKNLISDHRHHHHFSIATAKGWTDVGCGVSFNETELLNQAHFDVVFKVSKDPLHIAESFFPGDVDTFYIYPRAFTKASIRAQLLTTFIHEFGHILSLRHEHAMQRLDGKVPEEDAIQIGDMNPESIMGFSRDVRKFQQSDKDGLKKFYALPDRWTAGRVAIKDFPPVLLKRT
jgi:hypothetical protein